MEINTSLILIHEWLYHRNISRLSLQSPLPHQLLELKTLDGANMNLYLQVPTHKAYHEKLPKFIFSLVEGLGA